VQIAVLPAADDELKAAEDAGEMSSGGTESFNGDNGADSDEGGGDNKHLPSHKATDSATARESATESKPSKIATEASERSPRPSKRVAKTQVRSTAQIRREDLAACFHMPSELACRELGIGLTVLKRQCRKFGIKRWPFRKLKSLDRLITNVQSGMPPGGGENRTYAKSVAELEDQKRKMECCLTLELDNDTKRLQQAYSKATHKMKRLASRMVGDRDLSAHLGLDPEMLGYDMTEEEEEEEDAPQGSRFASLPASKVAEGIRQLQAWNQQAAAAPAQAPPAGPRPPQPVHTALASPPLAHDAETKPRVQELEPRGGKGDGDRKSSEGGEGKKGSHGGGASRGAEAARATTPAHRPPRPSAVSPSRMMCPAGARSKLAVVRPSAAPGSRQEKIARALAESAKAQAKESVGTKATARAVVKVEASVSSREETGREAGASATATSLVEMRWAPAVEVGVSEAPSTRQSDQEDKHAQDGEEGDKGSQREIGQGRSKRARRPSWRFLLGDDSNKTNKPGTEMTHYSWTKNVRSRSSNAPAQESAEALDAGEENNSEPESAIDALVSLACIAETCAEEPLTTPPAPERTLVSRGAEVKRSPLHRRLASGLPPGNSEAPRSRPHSVSGSRSLNAISNEARDSKPGCPYCIICQNPLADSMSSLRRSKSGILKSHRTGKSKSDSSALQAIEAGERPGPGRTMKRLNPRGEQRYMFLPCQHARTCHMCSMKIWLNPESGRCCPVCGERLEMRPLPFRPDMQRPVKLSTV